MMAYKCTINTFNTIHQHTQTRQHKSRNIGWRRECIVLDFPKLFFHFSLWCCTMYICWAEVLYVLECPYHKNVISFQWNFPCLSSYNFTKINDNIYDQWHWQLTWYFIHNKQKTSKDITAGWKLCINWHQLLESLFGNRHCSRKFRKISRKQLSSVSHKTLVNCHQSLAFRKEENTHENCEEFFVFLGHLWSIYNHVIFMQCLIDIINLRNEP